MKRWSKLSLLLFSLVAMPASAHERGDKAVGVVVSVTTERIVVKAADGHELGFTVGPETLFVRGERPARPEDVRVGERAVVEGKRLGDEVRAVRVRLGPAPAPK